jgi:DnaJ-class molecular chaperone
MEINLTEWLCAFQRSIKWLDNHQILINHPPEEPIIPNTYRCIKGYGMTNRYTHQHGNLIIHFHVKFTQKNFITNENQRKVIFSLFQFNL